VLLYAYKSVAYASKIVDHTFFTQFLEKRKRLKNTGIAGRKLLAFRFNFESLVLCKELNFSTKFISKFVFRKRKLRSSLQNVRFLTDQLYLSVQNAQIYAAVEKILKGANLEEITMRNVCLQVYKLYPEFDLSERKPFIKESVKKVKIILNKIPLNRVVLLLDNS